MPKYGWIKDNKLDPSEMEAHMKALDFPYTPQEIAALKDKTEMDALVAYMQVIGAAVTQKLAAAAKPAGEREHMVNPLAGNHKAIAEGKELYKNNCASCHGPDGKGDIGPSLADDVFLYVKGDLSDDVYFEVISNGTSEGVTLEGRPAKGGMPGYSGSLEKNKIWSLVSYIRSIQSK